MLKKFLQSDTFDYFCSPKFNAGQKYPATLAQSVEQRIRNAQVGSSSLPSGSKYRERPQSLSLYLEPLMWHLFYRGISPDPSRSARPAEAGCKERLWGLSFCLEPLTWQFWGRSNGMVDTYITLCSVEPICGIGPDHSVRPTPKQRETYPITWPDLPRHDRYSHPALAIE